MNSPIDDSQNPTLNELFASERKQCQANDARVKSIMHKVHQQSNINDLTLLVFVRLWMTLLNVGAIFYVAAVKKRSDLKPRTKHLDSKGHL